MHDIMVHHHVAIVTVRQEYILAVLIDAHILYFIGHSNREMNIGSIDISSP